MPHNAQHILEGAQTPATQPPGLTISAGAEPVTQRTSAFGGKLLPERGLLANVLLAGLLGLGAGSQARSAGGALAAGGLAPLQFKLQQRQREEEEELRRARLEQAQTQTRATEAGILTDKQRADAASVNAAANAVQAANAREFLPTKIAAAQVALERNASEALRAQGFRVVGPDEFDAGKEKGLPVRVEIVGEKMQLFIADDPNAMAPAFEFKDPGRPDKPIKVPQAPKAIQGQVVAGELLRRQRLDDQTVQGSADLRREQLNKKFNALIEDGDDDPAKISQLFNRRRGQGLYTADEARAIGQLILQGFQIQETANRAPSNLPPGTGAQDFVGATGIPIEKPTDEQLRDPNFAGVFREVSAGQWVAELSGDVLDTPEKAIAMLQLLAENNIQVRGGEAGAPATDPEKESLRQSIDRLTGSAKQKLIDVLDELNILKKDKKEQ